MKTLSAPPLVKKLAKANYGLPIGSFTVTPMSDAYDEFCTTFASVIKDNPNQFGDFQNLNLQFIPQHYTSFNFNNKVHYKESPLLKISSDSFYIELLPYGKEGVDLFKIEITNQGNGLGTRLVMLMNEISESYDTPIYLRPTDYKNTSIEQLRVFWKRMGFKRCCKGNYWTNSNPTK